MQSGATLRDERSLARWRRDLRGTASFGIATVVLEVIGFGVFFTAGVPPMLTDSAKFADYFARNTGAAFTIVLLSSLVLITFFVFLSGLRSIVREAGPESDYAAASLFGAGVIAVTFAALSAALIGAAALDTVSKTEPAAVRALFEASTVLGIVGAAPAALFLGLSAYGIQQSGALPRWLAWVGYLAAVLNIAALGTIYGGADPTAFYSATGFAGLVLGLIPFLIWVLLASVVIWARAGRLGSEKG